MRRWFRVLYQHQRHTQTSLPMSGGSLWMMILPIATLATHLQRIEIHTSLQICIALAVSNIFLLNRSKKWWMCKLKIGYTAVASNGKATDHFPAGLLFGLAGGWILSLVSLVGCLVSLSLDWDWEAFLSASKTDFGFIWLAWVGLVTCGGLSATGLVAFLLSKSAHKASSSSSYTTSTFFGDEAGEWVNSFIWSGFWEND